MTVQKRLGDQNGNLLAMPDGEIICIGSMLQMYGKKVT